MQDEGSDELASGPVYWSEQEAVETALKALESLPVARSLEVVTGWLSMAMSDAGQEAPPGMYHAALCCLRSVLSQPQAEEDSRIARDAGRLALGAQVDSRPLEPDRLSLKVRVLARLVEQVDAVPWGPGAATTRYERDAKKLARWLEHHMGWQVTNAETVNQLETALARPRTRGRNKGNARLLAVARAVGITISRDNLKKAFHPSRRK